MTQHDIEQLEREIGTMKAAGRTHIPIPIKSVEKLIAAERRRLQQVSR